MPDETSAEPPSGGAALHLFETEEGRRLNGPDRAAWLRWGPYLSERQWGTVREDYSPDGDAWNYLPHDHARSRAYRWGEDGIAGVSDDQQRWCLALALWNGRDPILKERMFGLTNEEGNHGEDVKELWWYLDATPTHSYMRLLYRYPQAAFPYADLLAENARRREHDRPEYELADTGVLAEGRYFDVTVEYAKAAPTDLVMRVTVTNRGPDTAELHVLPQLWARNTWAWEAGQPRAMLAMASDGSVTSSHPSLRGRRFEALQPAEFLFCDNDTNTARLYGIAGTPFPKDAINDAVVTGDRSRVNPARTGSKCAALTRLSLAPGASESLYFRLAIDDAKAEAPRLTRDDAEAVFARRIAEADAFYAVLQRDITDADQRLVQRQALAGMLWSKQLYHFDVRRWLDGDPAGPPPPEARKSGRDSDWRHLNNDDIVSMPDKWEYPWYASWDLAFHCVALALVDPQFAKGQLILLTREWYMQPNGQLPAYEWAFGDANPPVHAWAAWRVYQMDRALTGTADRGFLVRVFHKLMINFTWWVNRKDALGRNIFQGGFLGLDNIGVFDRSKPLPTGGRINQSDGTAWMAMYTLNLLQIALELARQDDAYEDIATKFFEHFLYIAGAMNGVETEASGLWDEEDRFYYDVLTVPDGHHVPLRARSLVGLIPLCAVGVLDSAAMEMFPAFAERTRWMLENRPDLAGLVSRWSEPGQGNRLLLSLLRRQRMGAILSRALDESEFLSPHGLRSVSKVHAEHPFVFVHEGTRFSVDYEPGESRTRMFGGNSNWRGPVWMPINYLLIEALMEFERFYGDDFTTACPTGSSNAATLSEVAHELGRRLTSLFLRGPDGRRPYRGAAEADPDSDDFIQFNEYFHGDTGAGLGASHQTGWTGLVALLLQPRHQSTGSSVPVPSSGG